MDVALEPVMAVIGCCAKLTQSRYTVHPEHNPLGFVETLTAMVSDSYARRSAGAGGGSYYQDREQQGCCARAPHGWVHGRVLIVTTPTSALPESDAWKCYNKLSKP